ncbi:GntR family transcriptional regulator [Roseomonas sp. GC11]|uniref:GntR family transcriptional regulator n=1 Tax=Roseomonas sp. GC11 TaxID=2950546 RepID=UPI00210BBBF6|nr:GntR family transcriptional regulator [Roseomonas sp. GC11]
MPNAAERAYDFIRQRILEGGFPPGTPLRESALATELGLSRTPVREALRRLLADGLVESIRNQGTFVTEIGAEDLEEVWDLRLMLEGHAAARAARRITPAGLAALEALAGAMEALDPGAPEAPRAFSALNNRFHMTIAAAAGARRLEGMIGQALEVPLVLLKPGLTRQAVDIAHSNQQHRELIAALRSGQGEWARLVMQAHLASTRPRRV